MTAHSHMLQLSRLLLLALLTIALGSTDSLLMAEEEAAGKKTASRRITLEKKYLLIPIQNGAPSVAVDLEIDKAPIRQFDCELAPTAADADFWTFLDIASLSGKEVTLRGTGASAEQLAAIEQGDTVPGSNKFYREPLRPQFHFSQKNDFFQTRTSRDF